jgi:hypothetical protein
VLEDRAVDGAEVGRAVRGRRRSLLVRGVLVVVEVEDVGVLTVPLSVQRIGSNVLLAHTPTWKVHTPLTPSASHDESPSVQRIFFGLVGGSFSGPLKTRRQSAFELPPPPKITARAGRTAHRDRPAPSAGAQLPPRIGGVLTQAIPPPSTKFP